MRWSLANLLVGFVYLLLLIGVIGFLWWPARDAVDDERTRAHRDARTMEQMADENVSRESGDQLVAVRSRLGAAREELLGDVARRTEIGLRWFSGARMNPALEIPYADEFRRAYAFAQDEMRGRVVQMIERTGLAVSNEVPMREPAFLAEKRDPSKEEMVDAQRLWHLEATCLGIGADHGAAPLEATRIRTLTEAVETPFERVELRLVLGVPSERVPELLHALRTPQADGPILGLEGLSMTPAPLPESFDEKARAAVRLDLRVVARLAEGETAR